MKIIKKISFNGSKWISKVKDRVWDKNLMGKMGKNFQEGIEIRIKIRQLWRKKSIYRQNGVEIFIANITRIALEI